MTTLENLWHGNIAPCEYNRLTNNSKYKEAVDLVNKAHEKLKSVLTDEQKDLLERYIVNCDELSIIIEEEAFKSGFELAAKLLIEIM